VLRPGELDQLECRRRGIHPVVMLGQDTDVQVASLGSARAALPKTVSTRT
jgi:hypothetical protein